MFTFVSWIAAKTVAAMATLSSEVARARMRERAEMLLLLSSSGKFSDNKYAFSYKDRLEK